MKRDIRNIVIVIGGGPAGLMAAGTAAACGAKVVLFEKNAKCGKKLLLTGSGKCNITNSAPFDTFLEKFAENKKFLYPAFKELFSDDLEEFFNQHNVFFETEENGKVFPVTKTSSSVLEALLAFCAKNNVDIHLGEPVISIEHIGQTDTNEPTGTTSCINWKVATNKQFYEAKSVIIATGGLSYPKTGSSGDGYRFAKDYAHNIAPTRPALVPLETIDTWSASLSGVSLKDVTVSLIENISDKPSKIIATQRGDLLFTHFGLSGPTILFLSRWLPDNFEEQAPHHTYIIMVDLLPMKSQSEIDTMLLQHISSNPSRQLKTILHKDFNIPISLASTIVTHCGYREEITGQEITKEKRKVILSKLKSLAFPLSKTRGYKEAMITAGGISTKEIRPQTMESKLVSNLFFAGELIDIDGFTGGYNLQAAFSTGYLAGKNASQ